jgi:hypothetical protein
MASLFSALSSLEVGFVSPSWFFVAARVDLGFQWLTSEQRHVLCKLRRIGMVGAALQWSFSSTALLRQRFLPDAVFRWCHVENAAVSARFVSSCKAT